MERFLHGGNIYEPAPTGSWLDFSANINPLGLSPTVRHSIEANIDEIVHYPDPHAKNLKSTIAEQYGVPQDRILLGNGAAELFYLFFYTYRPQIVLLPVPSFSEYERAALAAGCNVRYHVLESEQDFFPHLDKLVSDMKEADCLILGNPNNPTGVCLEHRTLLPLVESCAKQDKWLVVDESFLDFCSLREEKTLRFLVRDYPKTLVIQSLTKFYAIAGLRLGFCISAPSVCERLSMGKDVWNVNLLAQKAGVTALEEKIYQEESRIFLQKESAWLFDKLNTIKGIHAYQPSANFILLSIRETGQTSSMLSAKLRSRGILVRDCANYPGLDETFIRVAVRNRKEHEKLLTALEVSVL